MTTNDEWGATDSSSNFCRDFSGVVKEPFLGFNAKIGEGRTLLLHLPVEIEEVFDDAYAERVGEEETILLSLGKDWDTPDGGETAVHGSGNANKPVHASSAYGMLLDAVVGRVANYGANCQGRTDQEELEVDLDGAMEILKERGSVTEAAIWDGTRWEFHEVAFDYGEDKKKGDGSHIVSQRSLPTKFLGVAGEDKAKAAGKAPKPKAEKSAAAKETAKEKAERVKAEKSAAAASSNGDSEASGDPFADLEIPDELRAQLVEMATGADDAAGFQAAVYEDDGVLEAANESGALDLIVDDEQVVGVYEALTA